MEFKSYPTLHLYRGYTAEEGEGVMVEFSYHERKAILLLLIAPCTTTVQRSGQATFTKIKVRPTKGFALPLVYMPHYRHERFFRVIQAWKDSAALAAHLWLTDQDKSREILRNFALTTEDV